MGLNLNNFLNLDTESEEKRSFKFNLFNEV